MSEIVFVIRMITERGGDIMFTQGNGEILVKYNDVKNGIHIETGWDGTMLIDAPVDVDKYKLLAAITNYKEIKEELGEAK